MGELPTGTVTMLFSDIEGSTALLGRLGDQYGEDGQDFALGHTEGQALDLPAAFSLAASADLTQSSQRRH